MITLVVGIIEAKAGFSTGEKLLKFCTADKNGPQGVCSGYIIGVVDSHQTDKVKQDTDQSTMLSLSLPSDMEVQGTVNSTQPTLNI